MLADEVEHRFEGLLEERLVDPEEHLLALLLRIEHARFAQQLQVMGDRRAREGVLDSEKRGKEVFFWVDKAFLEQSLEAVLDFIRKHS